MKYFNKYANWLFSNLNENLAVFVLAFSLGLPLFGLLALTPVYEFWQAPLSACGAAVGTSLGSLLRKLL